MRAFKMTTLAAGASALLLTVPAMAQTIEAVIEGPMGPCTQAHFEPERYLADFAAAGWLPLPEDALPLAVELLSEAFLPMTHPREQSPASTVDARLDLAQAFWNEQLEGRLVLLNQETLLFMRGFTDSEGSQLLDCWMVTPDAEFVDGLIAGADAEAGAITDRAVTVSWGPDPLDDRTVLGLVATRQPLPQGPTHGLHTQLIRAAD